MDLRREMEGKVLVDNIMNNPAGRVSRAVRETNRLVGTTERQRTNI